MSRIVNRNGTLDPYNISPSEMRPNDRLGYKIIAVVDPSGKEWAAYAGFTDWTDEEVASGGDKLTKAQAEALFPNFSLLFRWRY